MKSNKIQLRTGKFATRILTYAIAASALAAASMASAQENIRATVDGNLVVFNDVQPIMINSRVMVPVRGVFEYMNADVKWDAINQCVVAKRGEDNIVIPVNSRTAKVNGSDVTLENPAIILRGRTLVPLRFLSESMHAKVTWLESTRMVVIDSAGPGAAPSPDPLHLLLISTIATQP